MSIDDALALARQFVELEHATHRALLLEPDDEALERVCRALGELFTFPGVLGRCTP
jgi:hypothetical protein